MVIVGTEESSMLLAAASGYLPLSVHETGAYLGEDWYGGETVGTLFIYPSPWASGRYVVASHGTIPGSYAKEMEALPWHWPDYVIFDAAITPRSTVQPPMVYLPDTFLAAGYFDHDWQIPADADGDGLIDRIDSDDDNDGVPDGDAGPGDVNGDGLFDVIDVQIAINMALDLTAPSSRADVNADGLVDVFDIQAVINLALSGAV